jgi:hypothetical protein
MIGRDALMPIAFDGKLNLHGKQVSTFFAPFSILLASIKSIVISHQMYVLEQPTSLTYDHTLVRKIQRQSITTNPLRPSFFGF